MWLPYVQVTLSLLNGLHAFCTLLIQCLFLFRWKLTPLSIYIKPLNAELNLICYLLELLGAQHILHVSRIKVNIV